MANKITTLIEVKVDEAIGGMRRFRQAVADADGFMGKFKAGASSAFGALKQHSAEAALAAGVALVAFGVKAVQAFEDAAKAARDLGDATGLTTEQASRWIAVADDMGVGADQLSTAFGRVAKTLDAKVWESYGIATRDASGRARQVNEILLDSFDVLAQTTNATERARIGNELFGRGYANIAPLLGKSREAMEAYLRSVERGQVITAAEERKAERMRLAQDALADAFGEVQLAVGEVLVELAPLIEAMAGATTAAVEFFERTKEFVNGKTIETLEEALVAEFTALGRTTEALEAAVEAEEEADRARKDATDRQKDATRAAEDRLQAERDLRNELLSQVDAQRAYEAAVDAGADAVGEFDATLQDDEATLEDVSDAIRDTTDTLIAQAQAFAASKGAADGSAESVRWQVDELYRLATALAPDSPLRASLLAYIGELQSIPAEIATRLALNITQGAVTTKGGDAIGGRYVPGGSNARAAGGPVAAGEAYLVGEKGPEILQMGSTGGHVAPNHALGGTTNNTINIYTNADPGSVKAAQRQFMRRNGPGLG